MLKLLMDVVWSPNEVRVESELNQWLGLIKSKIASRILENLNENTDHLDRYIECAEIKELPGAFMCCSFYQSDLNEALTRAGIFMGAGKGLSAGTLLKDTDYALINYKKLVAGHNLPGSVVRAFSQANYSPNPVEKAFFDAFLNNKRVSSLGKDFYLIGFSIQSTKDQIGVISHEIFHAHYLLTPLYRETARRFWRESVSINDQKAITSEVSRAYNTDDEDLVIDEFQAYLVQTSAEKDRLRTFVPKYRAQLLRALAEAGCRLIQL